LGAQVATTCGNLIVEALAPAEAREQEAAE
jgi:hypothetical protein